MHERFARRLRAGDTLIGTIVSLSSPEVIEIVSDAGFDWLFVEAEHAPVSAYVLQSMIRAAADTPCLVRVPNHEEIWIKRVLDMGAAGFIVPNVNSAEQARAIIGYAKYAPAGSRGVGLGRANRYGMNVSEYLQKANEFTTVVLQAEHVDAVTNIEAIARVEGVDAILVGPNDLAASMGHLGDLDHPEVQEAIAHVYKVCLRAGVAAGIFASGPAALRPAVERGFKLLACGVDTVMLGQAARTLLDETRLFT
jgi:2-keto-3-deoxy-L-rhamnonate aldolase RhmA